MTIKEAEQRMQDVREAIDQAEQDLNLMYDELDFLDDIINPDDEGV